MNFGYLLKAIKNQTINVGDASTCIYKHVKIFIRNNLLGSN